MNLRKKIVYIAGAYSGNVEDNILTAREAAIKVWELGFTVICPHLNTAHFDKDCKCRYEDYIEGDLQILERCDILLMLPNWHKSKGATEELRFVEALNNNFKKDFPYLANTRPLKKIFFSMPGLSDYAYNLKQLDDENS